MKHLLYLLVIVTLVYFSWHMLQGEVDEGTREELLQLPPDTRRLMTLQELQELQEKRESQQPSAETVTRPDGLAESPAGHEALAGIDEFTRLQPPAAGMSLACYSIGPFSARRELEEAAARVDKLELEASWRSEEQEVKIGYWVHLPEMSREKALEYKAKLDKHGDKEYFIGKDNVLSLGAFREKSRADRRVRQLRKIGIKAVLEPRYKTQNVFWLDLVEGLSATEHDNLASAMSGLSIQPRACR